MDTRTLTYPKGLEVFRGGWRWRRMVKGQTQTRTLTANSEQEAIEQAVLLNARLKTGTLPMGRSERVPLVRFMREFLVGKAVSEGTRRRYRACIDTFEYWLADHGHKDIAVGNATYTLLSRFFTARATRLIIPNQTRRWTRRLPERGAAKATLNFEKTFLKSIFAEAIRRGLLEKNPLDGIKAPKPRLSEWAEKHHPLKPDEARRFLRAAYDLRKDFGDAATLAIYTGMRAGELRNLEWPDIDFERRLIKVYPKDGWRPKGRSGMVPMCRKVFDVVMSRNKTDKYVLSGDTPVSKGLWLRLTKQAARKAGLTPQLRWHDLRHSCATMLRAAGVNLETIMLILRHHDIRMTMIYAAPSYEELLKAVGRIGGT